MADQIDLARRGPGRLSLRPPSGGDQQGQTGPCVIWAESQVRPLTESSFSACRPEHITTIIWQTHGPTRTVAGRDRIHAMDRMTTAQTTIGAGIAQHLMLRGRVCAMNPAQIDTPKTKTARVISPGCFCLAVASTGLAAPPLLMSAAVKGITSTYDRMARQLGAVSSCMKTPCDQKQTPWPPGWLPVIQA